MTFEESMSRLDEIIEQLNGKKLSLEESLTLYAEGAKLLSVCSDRLAEAKVQIETLTHERERAE